MPIKSLMRLIRSLNSVAYESKGMMTKLRSLIIDWHSAKLSVKDSFCIRSKRIFESVTATRFKSRSFTTGAVKKSDTFVIDLVGNTII